MRGDKAKDSIMQAARGSSCLYRMSTLFNWSFILCKESTMFLNNNINYYMSLLILSLIAKIY